MGKVYATTDPNITKREQRNMDRVRNIAAQGMVLLKNEGGLPLSSDVKRIALFGNGARRTIKGGTGSGDVNTRFNVTVEQAFEEAGYQVMTKGWMDKLDGVVQQAQMVYFGKLKEKMASGDPMVFIQEFMGNPFQEPKTAVPTFEDMPAADAAVFVIARNSGEGADRHNVPGDYRLEAGEIESIKEIVAKYGSVVVVLNVGGVMDTSELNAIQGVSAILLMSQCGNVGTRALVDILRGDQVPSGKLTTTWAKKYGDYASAETFSHMNGNIDDEYYTDGIYIGYRYFDSFNITPAYEFGFGLSYTQFEIGEGVMSIAGNKISVTVPVTNTGDQYSGREVVQVYVSAPAGNIEKPYQELKGYAKTPVLAPGETAAITVEFAAESMASYCEKCASYVLEPGKYYVRVGNSSRNTHVIGAVQVDELIVTEKLSNRIPKDEEVKEISAANATPYSYQEEVVELEAASECALVLDPADITTKEAKYHPAVELPASTSNQKWTVSDILDGKCTPEDLVAQLTIEEMADLCVGGQKPTEGGMGSIIGNAATLVPGAAGETTMKLLESRGLEAMVLADGPAGLRLNKEFAVDTNGEIIKESLGSPMPGLEMIMPQEAPEIPQDAQWHYQYATAIPIATQLAQSWDVDNIEEAGKIVGEEMVEMGVQLWLAPGMNIHRNPLCGRNFEYYSEDPLVSGRCAAADTRGVQSYAGIGTTIKHFALNNQEDNRQFSNAHISERAAREIYLKGFEICVKEAQPRSIMSSYNLINGIHAANNYDTINAIARDEWGFEGVLMTDWFTTGGFGDGDHKYPTSTPSRCIYAGNDLIMPGNAGDVANIIAAVDAPAGSVDWPITKADLQACAVRIVRSIVGSSLY